MATRSLPRPATYEDLLRVPDHKVAEILDGELIVSPRPAPRYAHVASALGADLVGPFQRGRGGPGGWWILDEPEVHLGRDVVVPDVAAWRLEPFDAIEMELGALWADISPAEAPITETDAAPVPERVG